MKKEEEKFSTKKLLNRVSHLEATINNLRSRNAGMGWKNYYSTSITGNNYLQEKEKIFRNLIERLLPGPVLDLAYGAYQAGH